RRARHVAPPRLLRASGPPPPCTPFPYTTLFRSAEEPHLVEGGAHALVDLLERRRRHRQREGDVVEHGAIGEEPVVLKHHPDAAADRKSTRLNSSHVEISYAVFCLKKNKQTTEAS